MIPFLWFTLFLSVPSVCDAFSLISPLTRTRTITPRNRETSSVHTTKSTTSGAIFFAPKTSTTRHLSPSDNSLDGETNASVSSSSSSSRNNDNDDIKVSSSVTIKKRLPRSERKALERNRKQRQEKEMKRKKKINTTSIQHESHSQQNKEVSKLNKESTADDIIQAIKHVQRVHDRYQMKLIANYLIDECVDNEYVAYQERSSLLSRLVVAVLHFEYYKVAQHAIKIRQLEYHSSLVPMESAAIIRGLLRTNKLTEAWEVLHDELSLPLEGESLDIPTNQERLIHRARSLGSIASKHFFQNESIVGVKACKLLSEVGPLIRQAKISAIDVDMPWLRIIQGASQCESSRRKQQQQQQGGSGRSTGTTKKVDDNGTTTNVAGTSISKGEEKKGQGQGQDIELSLPCNLVYSVLNAMTTFPSQNDDRVYEALSNALVRRVVFVTGAVSMSGCPTADRGEAAFIGRSNVGKSSLINMITNRKSLAYTSKRPGKTQQFNFFAINDKPDKEKEIKYGDVIDGEPDLDSFYMVDLPGFGFAKVPTNVKNEWLSFMNEYLSSRKTLRIVFHLIDGRHGPLEEDLNIMKQVGMSLPKHITYVIILTKADKNVKHASSTKNPGKVSVDVMNQLRENMKLNRVGTAPVIITSSETKLGRDDLWRYLRYAAEKG